jgi:hypothetical protein
MDLAAKATTKPVHQIPLNARKRVKAAVKKKRLQPNLVAKTNHTNKQAILKPPQIRGGFFYLKYMPVCCKNVNPMRLMWVILRVLY